MPGSSVVYYSGVALQLACVGACNDVGIGDYITPGVCKTLHRTLGAAPGLSPVRAPVKLSARASILLYLYLYLYYKRRIKNLSTQYQNP